jgi:2-polyprenyl-6-methoxyphenol hydroxylase-like FAD-dependent oxidoreductase
LFTVAPGSILVTQPILVVGAGPVGLTAALSLAQQGIAFRLIDRLPQRINQSRAAIIHARTCEQLEHLGVIDGFLSAGIRVHGIHILDPQGRTLLRNNLDGLPTEYPYFLGLGQDETERLLTEALAKLGVSVERGIELTALTQSDDAVTVMLNHNGREEKFTTPYVVACDGGRSAVRHQLGLSMDGETLDLYWVTADVRIEWQYPQDEAIVVPTPNGFFFASPLPHGRWRVVVDMGHKPEVLPTEIPLEDVQRACERLGVHLKLSDPVWISPFGVNTRMVSTMRSGRVFLAGDASHVHSPVGGQGMNTGIQDAINLAWKLALTIKGRTTPLLLDSFDVERHANAKRLLGFVGPATKMVSLRHPVAVELRRLAMLAASQLGLTAMAARRASEIDIHYRHSPVVGEHHQGTGEWLGAMVRHEAHPSLFDCWDFGKGPHPGERAADAHGLTAGTSEPHRLYQDWIGDHRHQLLVFTGRHPTAERVIQLAELAVKVEGESGGLIRARLVRPADVAGPDGGLVDHEGEAHHVYGARYECLYLIRPDGYVAFRSQPVEEEALREYLKRIFVGR